MFYAGAGCLISSFVAICVGPAQLVEAEKLAPFRPISVRTAASEATTIDLPGGALGRQYLVIVGTPAQVDHPAVVRVDRT